MSDVKNLQDLKQALQTAFNRTVNSTQNASIAGRTLADLNQNISDIEELQDKTQHRVNAKIETPYDANLAALYTAFNKVVKQYIRGNWGGDKAATKLAAQIVKNEKLSEQYRYIRTPDFS